MHIPGDVKLSKKFLCHSEVLHSVLFEVAVEIKWMHKTMDSLLTAGYRGASTEQAAVGQLAKSMWWQFLFIFF